jgi:hypothetical protein
LRQNRIQNLILSIITEFNAYIYLNKDKLEIKVPTIIYDENTYDELIKAAIKLSDKINGRYSF